MTIDKLPSGSYRIRQTSEGKTYSIVVDYKPTMKEATLLMAEKIHIEPTQTNKRKTFETCAKEYIEDRKNINSGGTARGYNSIIRAMSDKFKAIPIDEITQETVQKEVNLYAATHSSKSVRNFNGLISAVLRVYRNGLQFRITLPQKAVKKQIRATKDDVTRILEASEGTDYHIPFQLGVLGLRRGEICALTLADLDGNMLTINKDKIEVEGAETHWVIKPIPKTEKSNRTIPIPKKLADEIKEKGYIFEKTPPMLVHTLHSYQKQLDIPQFRFHDLRSYCASYLHSLGYADKYIQGFAGWSSSYTMNRIYKEELEDKILPTRSEMADSLL